jgi:hypothetical protein
MFNICSRRAVSPVLMIIAIVALALPARAGQQVPFKGYADDMATSFEPTPDGGFHLTNAATGKATHLGRFTRVGSGDIHPDGTLEATLVWTAANGDQLFSDVEVTSLTATTITGTYIFTGGTGRFKNASGAADFVGITSDGIHYAVLFSGTISSPGTSKK